MGKSLLFLLVGIGIGVLVAPDKGSNTLNNLLGKAEDLKDDAEYYLLTAADKIMSKVKQAGNTAE